MNRARYILIRDNSLISDKKKHFFILLIFLLLNASQLWAGITLSGHVALGNPPSYLSQIYLTWAVTPDIAGIDHYEIHNTANYGAPISTTENTYQVLDACTSCYYYVKAVNNLGNEIDRSNQLLSSLPPCLFIPFLGDIEPNDNEAFAGAGVPRNTVPSPHYYGYISNSSDQDWYRFYAYEGKTIEQRIAVESTGTYIGWLIKAPNGSVIHQFNGLGSSTFSDQYSYIVPTGGQGYYSMRVWNINANATSTRYDFDLKITPHTDLEGPTVVTNLTATRVSSTEVDLSWPHSIDNIGPVFYGVIGGVWSTSCTFDRITFDNFFTVKNLTPNTTYNLYVGAGDAAGNMNVTSVGYVQVTTLPQSTDTTPPTTPGNLHWYGITTTSVALAWNPTSDNEGVMGYRIYNATNDAFIASTIYTSYAVTGLNAGGSYSFYVKAYDATNNQSLASNISAVSLPDSASTEPAPPGNDVEIPIQVALPSGGTATVTVEFAQITSGGNLDITAVNTPPSSPPSGFAFLDTIYYISTTANYAPPVMVTIPYDETQVGGSEANLRLFHWENGQWVDVTVSVDIVNNTITGQVNTISPFGIGYPYFGGGGGYSTGANENMIAIIAILTISAGLFILRRQKWIKV